jgi:hypothetical protein
MVRVLALVVAATSVAATVVHAEDFPLAIGDRIRVTAPSVIPPPPGLFATINVGTLTSLEGGALTFVRPGEVKTPTRVTLHQLERLEVSRGTTRKTLVGGAVGAVVSVALYAVLLSSLPSNEPSVYGQDLLLPDAGTKVAGLFAFGGAGFIVGAIMGSTYKTDRWVTVSLRDLRVGSVAVPIEPEARLR